MNNKGFTLIEILVALSIFAILATITSSSLYYAFNTRVRVNKQADQLNQLELTFSILQQDTSQIIARAVRGNEMRLFPTIVGQAEYLEFTRDGIVNPNSMEKRSTLKRIAFVCTDGQLIRRTWATLDPLDRNVYKDHILLNKLSECQFAYLNKNLQSLTEWREQSVDQNQHPEPFPKAFQIKLAYKKLGTMNLLFIIPGALYAAN